MAILQQNIQKFLQDPVGLKYAAFTFASITTAIVYYHPWRRAKLVRLLGNKFFFWGLMMIIVWCFFTLRLEGNTSHHAAIKSATKSAILALLITIFSELKLIIAPFWLAWIAAYYLHIE